MATVTTVVRASSLLALVLARDALSACSDTEWRRSWVRHRVRLSTSENWAWGDVGVWVGRVNAVVHSIIYIMCNLVLERRTVRDMSTFIESVSSSYMEVKLRGRCRFIWRGWGESRLKISKGMRWGWKCDVTIVQTARNHLTCWTTTLRGVISGAVALCMIGLVHVRRLWSDSYSGAARMHSWFESWYRADIATAMTHYFFCVCAHMYYVVLELVIRIFSQKTKFWRLRYPVEWTEFSRALGAYIYTLDRQNSALTSLSV